MDPRDIVKRAGPAKARELFLELNGVLMREICKEAGLSWHPRGTTASKWSPSKRRENLATAIYDAVTGSDSSLAAAKLIEAWLRLKKQPMLSDYLDALGVKHTSGFTDVDFIKEKDADTLRAEGRKLMDKHAPADVAIYLHYLDHDFKTTLYGDDQKISASLAPAPEARAQLP